VSPPPRRGQTPSWLGTILVVVAVAVMMLRAAVELRRGVTPGASPATPATGSERRDGG
jgi:hypothetical protein